MGIPFLNAPWINVSMEADGDDEFNFDDLGDGSTDDTLTEDDDTGDEAGADAADAEADPIAELDDGTGDDLGELGDDTNVDAVEPVDKEAGAKEAIKEEDKQKPETPAPKDKSSKGSKTSLKKGAQKSKTAEGGYKEQPTVGLYVSDESLSPLYRRTRVRGVQLNYRPLGTLVASVEGMQTMINGVVQRYEEEARERYMAEEKKKRSDDYSLIVVGTDTDPQLYEETEAAPEDVAFVLADPEDAYSEGVIAGLESRGYAVYRSVEAAITAWRPALKQAV